MKHQGAACGAPTFYSTPLIDPQVIFLHGAGSNADFWHEQHVAFPQAHYLNLPGHVSVLPGPRLSAPNTQPSALSPQHWIEGYADWVSDYVRVNGMESVALNGHSMGGAVALTLALREPMWLRGLVLTGTGARLRVSPRLLELLRTDYPAAVGMIVQESLPPMSEALTYKQKIRINGVKRHILRASQAITLGDYEACDSFDVLSKIGEIKVPTLCIVGELDSMTPPKYSEYLHREIRGSRLEVVEGAGHMLPLEKPGEYNRRVVEFLETIVRYD